MAVKNLLYFILFAANYRRITAIGYGLWVVFLLYLLLFLLVES